MKRNSKQNKSTFHKNMEIMTNKRIESMSIMDSEGYIRLLQDHLTGYYLVFNGRLNQSYYAKSYQKAENHFKSMIAKC